MIFLVVVALVLVTALLVMSRRHQKIHCAHLRELSAALVALSAFIADRVPGELPEDVRTFVEEWKSQESEASDDDPEHERL